MYTMQGSHIKKEKGDGDGGEYGMVTVTAMQGQSVSGAGGD